MEKENSRSKKQTAAVIGATGLIGSHLVNQLQADPGYGSIRLIVRRPVHSDHPSTAIKEIDFEDQEAFRSALEGADALFCAVGTTSRKVNRDRAAYRKVDVDIPLHAARICEKTGCAQFLLVSSIGASSNSSTFYLRLKGEVEDALKGMSIPSISVFRPSLLLGNRGEHRFGERIAQWVMEPLSFAVPSRYKPIRASDVARAMVGVSRQFTPGFRIYHYAEMMDIIAADR